MYKANILPLFSTPVYVNNIQDTKDILNLVKTLNYKPAGFYSSGTFIENWHTTDDVYILNDLRFVELKKNIDKEINCFLKEHLKFSNKINFNITTSWIVKHLPGHFSQPHYHPNSLYSGVVYLQVDTDSGCISFDSKGQTSQLYPIEMEIELEQNNIFNSVRWEFLPKNNDIIIFPSHLNHRVSVNTSKIDRYSIAFNIFPSGILGRNTINELAI